MKLLNQLKGIVSKNPQKLTDGLSKVTSQIDKRTGGKYADKLEKVTTTVEGQIEKLAGDDITVVDDVDDVDAAEMVDDASDQPTTDSSN